MSQARHSRAKEIFLETAELPAERRRVYLEEACGDDTELRREVESLLVHHSPDTILQDGSGAAEPAGVLPASSVESRTRDFGRFFATRPARLAWTLVSAAVLFAIGLLTHTRIERALLGVREDELTTILDGAIQSLDLWIGEHESQLDFLTEDPRFVPYVQELLAVGEQGGDRVEAWNRSPAYSALLERLQFFRDTTGAAGFAVVNDRGELVFTGNNYETGLVLDEELSREVSLAFRGQKVFVRPHRYEDLVGGTEGGTMYSFVLGPLRDAGGRVIAAVANVHHAYGTRSISGILEVSRPGETGETFAFDADGLMLSESRFTEELRRSGHAPEVAGEGEDWRVGAQLNLQIRDPGGDLTRGHVPELEAGARPLTRLAAMAVAARGKSDPDELRGVLLESYRNYRGVEVIGTWRWLAEHDFAVATEMEAGEALRPLVYLEMTFGGLFVLLTGFVGVALMSAFSSAQLRKRVRELRELGPYHLATPIAEGGMGIVYLAEHTLLKRRTAVKVLSGELSKTNVARFEREVSLASKLTHPNTIEIYDYGRTPEGVFYYAMEYVEGPTLTELVMRYGLPSPERVVHILEQVCASLGEAHREGLVHRDIKPQNIMLCVRGGEHDVVKVLDFGLVKEVTKITSDSLSRGIHLGGTPLYMAPERITSPKDLDARVDIYSLGCVAYYLLSGRPAFQPEGDLDLLDKIVNAEPEPLHQICQRSVPGELEKLVSDCLAKDRGSRPPTVFAIMDRLESLAGVGRWTQEEAAQWWKQVYSNSRSD